jgi:hypothetical protein
MLWARSQESNELRDNILIVVEEFEDATEFDEAELNNYIHDDVVINALINALVYEAAMRDIDGDVMAARIAGTLREHDVAELES